MVQLTNAEEHSSAEVQEDHSDAKCRVSVEPRHPSRSPLVATRTLCLRVEGHMAEQLAGAETWPTPEEQAVDGQLTQPNGGHRTLRTHHRPMSREMKNTFSLDCLADKQAASLLVRAKCSVGNVTDNAS